MLPREITVLVAVACVLPLALKLLGVDLGFEPPPQDGATLALRQGQELVDALHRALRGSFVHLLLDWTAVLLALVTGVLAMGHYRMRRDAVTAVVGMAMLAAGIVDAFHSLAASQVLLPLAATGEYVPFSWAISRSWHAGVLMLGALLFVLRPAAAEVMGPRLLGALGLGMGGLAWVLVNGLVAMERVPTMVRPGALFPRPWDIIPILIYVLAAASVFPRLHRRRPSVFTHALLFSTVPQVAAELHMALGSHALLDHDHVSAHFLRLVGYAVLAAGIAVDYLDQHRRVKRQQVELAAAVAAVGLLNQQLRRTVDELEQYTYAASHDLKAPLRAVASICAWLEEDLAAGQTDKLPEHLALMRSRIVRMERLLADLRAYARIGRSEVVVREVHTRELVEGMVQAIAPPPGFQVELQGDFPVLRTAAGPLEQVLQNLVTNAIKHHGGDRGHVLVRAAPGADFVHFDVVDDGPGIPAEYRERVFQVFKTLRPRDEVEGSGMGLAIVKKIIEGAGGRITLEEAEGGGAAFRFTWPVAWPERREQ